MTFKSPVLLLLAIIVASTSFAQTQNSVDLVPSWNKNEVHKIKFTSTTTDNNNGKSQNYISTFDAGFVVKEVSDDGYLVEWTFSNAVLAENEPVLENQITGKMLNTKLLIRLSDVGRFVELVNAEQVKEVANKAVDELIKNSTANPAMNAQYQTAKQLISSKQGLEIAILKPIKFYTFSFGFNYKLNFVQTNNIKFPNPFGGAPFDAVEKVQLTKLDSRDSVCIIETSKVMESDLLKASVIDYIKKATNSNPQALNEMNNAILEMTEMTMQQIDYSKGLVQKGFFKRTANLGFQNRVSLLEIKAVDY